MADQVQTAVAAPLIDTDRDAILSEMSAGAHRPAAAAQPEPAKEAPTSAEAAPETDAPEDAKPAEEAPAKDAAPPQKPKPDPETERKLAEIQREQKAAAVAKREAAEERARLAAERKLAENDAAELAAFKAAVARAKYDPAAVYRALGVKEDRFEEIARSLMALSPKGAENPAYRTEAERLLREREKADELSSLREQVTALKEAQDQRWAVMEAERQAAQHMDGVFSTARAQTESPLLAQAFAKNPKKAEARLAAIALELAQTNGELPDAADVIATYTARRKEEIEDLGLSVDEYLKQNKAPAPAGTKTQDQAAGEKRPVKTLTNDLNASTPVRERVELSEAEEREQLLAEMAKLRAAGGLDTAYR